MCLSIKKFNQKQILQVSEFDHIKLGSRDSFTLGIKDIIRVLE